MNEQGSEAWFQARAGKVTASRVADVLARSAPKLALCVLDDDGKIVEKLGNGAAAEKKAETRRKAGAKVELAEYASGAPLEARQTYLMQVITEILIDGPLPGFKASATEWGKEQEPRAKHAYQVVTGNFVDDAGFVDHPSIRRFGASADGLVDEDGGVEIKCPYSSINHIVTVESGRMPSQHRAQVQANMLVHGRAWWDFISYDPRMPKPIDLFVRRIYRDEAYLNGVVTPGVEEFVRDVEEAVERIRTMPESAMVVLSEIKSQVEPEQENVEC